MSDEFDSHSETHYSSFWPLFIVLIGLLIWSGYQVFATNSQRSLYSKQFQAEMPAITDAQNVGQRYVALMKDLVETAQKDPAAAQIVKDAIQVGLIHVNPGTNTTAAPVGPAPSSGTDTATTSKP
jgi:hypothetical protein